MSSRKQDKAVRNLLQIWQMYKAKGKKKIQQFLRNLLIVKRRTSRSRAGFVLPTMVLLLLVVGLVVTALIFRSVLQTNQVIGERQQQEIYNAATPAIDRAKAKLENLFTKDERYPVGLPPENVLLEMLHDARYDLPGEDGSPGEERLDLNGDGKLDNAWVYQDSATGNRVAYSILMASQGQVSGNNIDIKSSDQDKAAAMVVRYGPMSSTQLGSSSCQIQNGGLATEQGWFKDSSSTAFLRKNFQVNAVVLNSNLSSQPAATLELQQDRKVDRGNKWGAWFRYDLELFPDPPFNWNGAIHTEGSLFFGAYNGFKAYLISSPSSCLYGKDGIEASEISVTEQKDQNGQTTFQGQIASAAMGARYDFLDDPKTSIDRTPSASTALLKEEDSVKDSGTNPNPLKPDHIALDPLALFTQDKSRARNANDLSNTDIRDKENWDDENPLAKGDTARIFNKQELTPYIDDTYRADNRYGPKLPKGGLPSGKKVGNPILSTEPNYQELVSNTPPVGNPEKLGLDGYWERRASNQGLRVIVGQRLELGDPLALPTTLPARAHEALQRRTLRDNPAAVQATAIYHYEHNTDFPITCLSTTVHPGTDETLKRSATFEPITFKDSSGTDVTLYSDFFTGRGTNGWEYEFTGGPPNASMLKALKNLAFFAGDPYGAFPPVQDSSTSQAVPTAGQVTHPYPELTKWGDFSNLRRSLKNLDASSYADLSIADQSYLQTASCTLGMLADNIKALQDFDYANNWDLVPDLTTPQLLDNLNTELGETDYDALTTPEETIAKLETKNPNLAPLARLVYLKEQVELDRKNGASYSCSLSGTLNKLCPTGTKYQALYYIFPATAHSEERLADTYISKINLETYQAISDPDLDSIKLTPRTSDITTWKTRPVDVTSTYSASTAAPNDHQNELVKYVDSSGTKYYRVPFKDTALFNGREMMNVRVLNVDLDLLRRNKPASGDTWLPKSGVIYAFREDAVREDAIARPAIGTWGDYTTVWNNNTASGPPLTGSPVWRMDATPTSPKDPPVNDDTGISPKPIDYYPDPERRPYGFRLKNGSNIMRSPSGADNTYGLSFISDNPAYIQGDFNLHQNSSGALLEEFTDYTQDQSSFWSNFYNRTSKNLQFAKPGQDSWRPTEILADAVTILSNNFCDGSIEDGFLKAGIPTTTSTPSVALDNYGCGTGDGYTSYLNQNRPSASTPFTNSTQFDNLVRENSKDLKSPIRISENGDPLLATVTYNSDYYYNFASGKMTETAATLPNDPTRVNTIFVTGTVTSRANQSYGGFNNLPRFLENWKKDGRDLFISGSFIQLNFSTYATAPYDQDDWEPYQTASMTATNRNYFEPPDRRWGYDVGLQYAPAGAISRRFAVSNSIRSEFYNELPVDDPYILNLRCAKKLGSGGGRVDPNATCS